MKISFLSQFNMVELDTLNQSEGPSGLFELGQRSEKKKARQNKGNSIFLFIYTGEKEFKEFPI